MIAGPNGSGKSTLVNWLQDEFSVNFYSFLNADDIFAAIKSNHAYSPKFPVSHDDLLAYVNTSTYDESAKCFFRNGGINIDGDCVLFDDEAINSYTIALFTNFLQDEFIKRGESFSQETVFSHPSKIAALKKAREAGYRTYLYFVATNNASLNKLRVANRHAQGGHSVPDDKIVSRYPRAIAQLRLALPYLSRAFVFDNSGPEMDFLGQYENGSGWVFSRPVDKLPNWLALALG